MNAVQWLTVAVTLLLLTGWLSWTATRIDRLHTRVETQRAVLESRLLRRSAVTSEVASSGVLDPASSLMLADVAHAAREAEVAAEAAQAESDLTAALNVTFGNVAEVAQLRGDPQVSLLIDELAAACRDVGLARRFYNNTVRAAWRLRRKLRVRLFRLAGRAPAPASAEFDDTVPAGLA